MTSLPGISSLAFTAARQLQLVALACRLRAQQPSHALPAALRAT